MNSSADLQVADDPPLLSLMLEDMERADPLYRPTNYWSIWQKPIVSELRRHGLKDFRRRQSPLLASFSATDSPPTHYTVGLKRIRWLHNRISMHIPGWPQLLDRASEFLTHRLPIQDHYGISNEQIHELAVNYCESYIAARGARPLGEIEASTYGNPEDLFMVREKPCTLPFLFCYLRYAYLAPLFDFDGAKIVVELSSGSGKQAEVLKKLFPDMTILLFDIPPQLYVCHQFLSSVFPNAVVPYRRTREYNSLDDIEPGRIHFLGAWQMPLLANRPHDLFISCASLGEMEPKNARNYLNFVNTSASAAYLLQLREGHAVTGKAGRPGVLERTLPADYEAALCDFEVVDRSNDVTPLGQGPKVGGYEATFWRRTEKSGSAVGNRTRA